MYTDYETTKLIRCYSEAKRRCTKTNHTQYPEYGGRGIQFKFNSFDEFKKAIGPKLNDSFSIDRIDNDGHYELGNVRWATRTQQARNKRKYKSNSSGISGVSFDSKMNRWVSQHNRVIYYRGKDFFEACCARKTAELGAP